MGSVVIKPNKNEDFYVIWNTIIDQPTGYGTRQEWMNYDPKTYPERRMARADEFGSSCMICTDCWSGGEIVIHNVTKKLRTVKFSDFAAFTKEFLDAFPENWSGLSAPKAARAVLKKYGTLFDYED